jgi:hypothetical protein
VRALSPAEVLALWESGRSLHPLDQGVLALRMSSPEGSAGDVADWPLGRRNRAIADLRGRCFGPQMRALTKCPHCGEAIEFAFDVAALIAEPGPAAENVALACADYRLPTSRILARVAGESDIEAAAALLCESCRIGGEATALSSEQMDEVGEALARADPLAEIAFDFECPACGEDFREGLDIAEFFWREIEVEARRLLIDVHTLASAYGWREADVLALSPARRAFYVERVLG